MSSLENLSKNTPKIRDESQEKQQINENGYAERRRQADMENCACMHALHAGISAQKSRE